MDLSEAPTPSVDTPVADEPIDEHLKEDEDDEQKRKSSKLATDDLKCKWTNCQEPPTTNLPTLVRHLNNLHLNHTNNVVSHTLMKYTCLWEGCSRYGIEQPSRFALISHCRTHTGEKPYFCPIPECEKHFTRSDALAKHVKGVHDLHVLKDAVTLNKERVKKGRMEANFFNQENTSELEFLSMIEEDYELRTPWWFTRDYLNVLGDEDSSVQSVYRIPLSSKQYQAAIIRYKAYSHVEPEDLIVKTNSDALKALDENIDFESLTDLDQLKNLHDTLTHRLTTSNKVNKIVTKQLQDLTETKRKHWLINQVLLDGNVKLSVPTNTTGANHRDKYDTELYDSIKST